MRNEKRNVSDPFGSGRGNDDLQVYGTNNTILYSVGDGTDTVRTHNAANPNNLLKLVVWSINSRRWRHGGRRLQTRDGNVQRRAA